VFLGEHVTPLFTQVRGIGILRSSAHRKEGRVFSLKPRPAHVPFVLPYPDEARHDHTDGTGMGLPFASVSS
jgi:hypothetical protein